MVVVLVVVVGVEKLVNEKTYSYVTFIIYGDLLAARGDAQKELFSTIFGAEPLESWSVTVESPERIPQQKCKPKLQQKANLPLFASNQSETRTT